MQPIDLLNSKLHGAELLSAALRYAEMGYRVFPCIPGTKKPITAHGFHDATTDPEQIERWWAQYPRANIGIPTAHLVVIDIDGTNNPWPDDPERAADLAGAGAIALTPRGGRHYLFRQAAGKHWRCSESQLAPKVDIRADGGYIVVAPSKTGDGAYTWAPGLELDGPPERLPEPPAWLASLLDALASVPGPTCTTTAPGTSNVIPEGQRNATLARLAGTMRRRGMTQAEIAAALLQTNKDRCAPPLSPHEVERIAASIARYAPDEVSVALVEGHWDQLVQTPKLARYAPGQIATAPVLTCLADVEPRPVSWLWPGRIPLGRITLLVGRPGEGKSFLTIDAASRVSTGTPWPDGSACPKGSIILISAEDDPASVIRPRLDAHSADVSRVHLLAAVRRADGKGTYERLITLADVDAIETALARTPDCRLLIIDPVGDFLGGQTDSHRDNEVRSVLAPIAALAEKYGPAVLVVAHRRKSAGSIADDLALGSRAFTGIARAVWHLTRDPENKSRRLMLPGKNNLAREGDGLAFTIAGGPPHIVWERDPVSMSADDALAAETASRNTKPGPDADALDAATDWLRSTLASGPRLARELADEWCNGQGGGKRTLHRAKEALQVEAFRLEVPGPWWWRLPPNIAKTTPESGHLGNLGNLAKTKGNLTNLDAGEPKVAKLNYLGNLGPGAEGGEKTSTRHSVEDLGDDEGPATDAPAGPDCKRGRLFPDTPRLPD
jgi:hypothetical protein